ncbi:hypothetical protein [Aquamicrobium terrae]|uniref:Uncharacterized protein n=1 Tax=Aquamicrobium terrae TaxID=1324945 RepID=A0ABV2MV16_9HYPH
MMRVEVTYRGYCGVANHDAESGRILIEDTQDIDDLSCSGANYEEAFARFCERVDKWYDAGVPSSDWVPRFAWLPKPLSDGGYAFLEKYWEIKTEAGIARRIFQSRHDAYTHYTESPM